MENILKMTKMVYSCFYDKNGCIQKEPAGKIARMKLPQTHIDFLYRYIEFVMNSKLLNEASMIYIKSPYDAAKAVFEFYNKENPDSAVNVKTAISNLDYNRRKVNKAFDEDMLTQVVFYSHKVNIEKYQKQLDDAMTKYSKGSIFEGKVMIALPKSVGIEEPSKEEIESFMIMLSAYRTANRKLVEEQIQDMYGSVVAYFNYLSTLTYRDDKQEEQFRQMSNFLNGTQETDDVLDFTEIEID